MLVHLQKVPKHINCIRQIYIHKLRLVSSEEISGFMRYPPVFRSTLFSIGSFFHRQPEIETFYDLSNDV